MYSNLYLELITRELIIIWDFQEEMEDQFCLLPKGLIADEI